MRFFLIGFLLFCLGCGGQEMNYSVEEGKIRGDFLGCAVGAFVNGMENISGFQAMIGKKLAVVLWYVHWPSPFPKEEADLVSSNGSIPLITWEPWVTREGQACPMEAIAAGSYEGYVRSFLQAAKDWGKPLFLRFAHEMNGNWYPWDGVHNGSQESGSQNYKRAWIYIYNVREELGANNVNLVWCPNNWSLPEADWNQAVNYYPGDQYVDWIGIDGYNWGYSDWMSFEQIFENIYKTLTFLTTKPVMIAEFASAEQGGSKADWIADAFQKIKDKYSRVKIFCWFNINKEREWRINSSSSSEAAFKKSLQDDYFLDKI